MTEHVILLTEAEAADFLAMSPGTLANWRSEGVGPPYLRLRDRAIRYDQTELTIWATRQRVDPSEKETA